MSTEKEKTPETEVKEKTPEKVQEQKTLRPKTRSKPKPKPKPKTSKQVVAEAVKQLDGSLRNIEKAIVMFRQEGQGISRLVNAKRHMTEVRKYLDPYLK